MKPERTCHCPLGLPIFSIHRLYPPLHEYYCERGHDPHFLKTSNIPAFLYPLDTGSISKGKREVT